MTNPFDLNEYEDDYALDGFFSSVKKALKKKGGVFKKIVKSKKNVAKKLHKKKIKIARSKANVYKRKLATGRAIRRSQMRVLRGNESIGRSIKRSRARIHADKKASEVQIHAAFLGKKYGAKLDKFKASKAFQTTKKAVGMAVGGYFLGPLVGMGGSGTLTGAIGKSLAQTAIQEGAKKVVTNKLAAQQRKKEELILRQIRGDIMSALNVDSAQIQKLQNDPDFKRIMNQMIRDGKSLEDIQAAWASSDTYQYLVRKNVPKTFERPLYNAMVSEGIPPEVARTEAPLMANELVDNAADTVEAKAGLNIKTVALALIPIAAAALLGG